MKVQITFEITDDQRMAIGIAQGDGYRQATRDELINYINGVVFDALEGAAIDFRHAMDEAISRIRPMPKTNGERDATTGST